MSANGTMLKEIIEEGKKELDNILDIGIVKGRLEEKKRSREDIETAIDLMACMVYFDSKIFPNNRIKNVRFSHDKSSESFAAYNHPSDGKHPLEMYEVRVRELFGDIKKYLIGIFLFDENGRLLKSDHNILKLPKATYEERMLSFAIHEVRHRLQKNGIKMFAEGKTYTDNQINFYIEFWTKWDRSEIEFDATIVENLALWTIHNQAGKEELCNLISIEGVVAE